MNLHLRDQLNALSGHTHTGAGGDGAAAIAPTSITMGAGAILQSKGADVASASTLGIGSDGNYFNVTGTTTINAITTKQAGTVIILRFNGALTVTHGSGITLQTGSSWAAPAGAMMMLVSHGSNDWREVTRWSIGANVVRGYIWVVPDTIDSADANAVKVSGPPAVYPAATSAGFTFPVPTDFVAVHSAVVHLDSGGTVDVSGSLGSMTPGAIKTFVRSSSGNYVGLCVQYTA